MCCVCFHYCFADFILCYLLKSFANVIGTLSAIVHVRTHTHTFIPKKSAHTYYPIYTIIHGIQTISDNVIINFHFVFKKRDIRRFGHICSTRTCHRHDKIRICVHGRGCSIDRKICRHITAFNLSIYYPLNIHPYHHNIGIIFN